VLTVVSSLDPIRFDFTVSEAEYLTYARAGRAEGRTGQAISGLELILADGSVHTRTGRVTVVGRGVNTETGTLPIQAVFANPGGLIRPGQFGRVRFPITTRKQAIVIPQRAVQELQGTFNVYVVGQDSVVQVRTVKPANRIGSDWVIAEGLEPADRIVVEGIQKVRPGAKVRPTAASAAAPSTQNQADSTAK
jgi:membrane fusion protein (multidrug efflux system)